MKQLTILLLSIVCLSNVQAQETINLHDSNPSLLYRGFNNHFEITSPEWQNIDFSLNCIDCEVESNLNGKPLPNNQFIIKPTPGKVATLEYIRPGKETIRQVFECSNLPDPNIYLNGVVAGSLIDEAALSSGVQLTSEYPSIITLRSTFQLVAWKLTVDGNDFDGLGDQLTAEAIHAIQTLGPDSHFTILCDVRDMNGITRRKGADYFILK